MFNRSKARKPKETHCYKSQGGIKASHLWPQGHLLLSLSAWLDTYEHMNALQLTYSYYWHWRILGFDNAAACIRTLQVFERLWTSKSILIWFVHLLTKQHFVTIGNQLQALISSGSHRFICATTMRIDWCFWLFVWGSKYLQEDSLIFLRCTLQLTFNQSLPFWTTCV